MKTKIFNIFMLLAVAIGFAACNDDTEPVLSLTDAGNVTEQNIPSTLVLDKANASGVVFSLTWTAPEFNVKVAQNYRVEISNSADFATTASVATTAATTYSVTADELNTAVLEYMPSVEEVSPIDVFVRVRCELNDDPAGGYVVGEQTFPVNVTPYPGEYPRLYVIGSIQGWNISSSNYFLRDREGNNVYTGELGIPNGAQFRFYKELGDWDKNSYGSQVEDAGVNITLTDGAYSGALVEGKGSWIFPADAEGTYNCTVDLTNMTVKFEYAGEYRDTAEDPGTGGDEPASAEGCFMVGNINNWSLAPTATEGQMTESYEGSNVWSATLNLPDSGNGYSYFRFYTKLENDNWGDGTWGSTTGADFEITITDGLGEAEVLEGSQGSFMVPTGTYEVSLDLNNSSLVVVPVE